MARAACGMRYPGKVGKVVLKVYFTDPWGSRDLSGAFAMSKLFYCVNICTPDRKAMIAPWCLSRQEH